MCVCACERENRRETEQGTLVMIPSYTKLLQGLSLPNGTGSDGVLAELQCFPLKS